MLVVVGIQNTFSKIENYQEAFIEKRPLKSRIVVCGETPWEPDRNLKGRGGMDRVLGRSGRVLRLRLGRSGRVCRPDRVSENCFPVPLTVEMDENLLNFNPRPN